MSVERDFIRVAAGSCPIDGHDWEARGGRGCPMFDDLDGMDPDGIRCSSRYPSQPVFHCKRCGAIDYGEPGGPGWEHCQQCQSRAV